MTETHAKLEIGTVPNRYEGHAPVPAGSPAATPGAHDDPPATTKIAYVEVSSTRVLDGGAIRRELRPVLTAAPRWSSYPM